MLIQYMNGNIDFYPFAEDSEDLFKSQVFNTILHKHISKNKNVQFKNIPDFYKTIDTFTIETGKEYQVSFEDETYTVRVVSLSDIENNN